MSDKYFLFVILCFVSIHTANADMKNIEIRGVGSTSLKARSFNEKYGGWRDIEYSGAGASFKIYAVPSGMDTSAEGVVAYPSADSLSPDKRYLLTQRTNAGEVIDDEGNSFISSQAYCDLISMDTGCTVNVGSVFQCDGAWQGEQWKMANGDVFDISSAGVPPKSLLAKMAGLVEKESRASILRDYVFMGMPSYMACYPPEQYIHDYNDVAFYFAQGGEYLLAMQIYERILPLAPLRVPLKLNVADSLWALGKHDQAKRYYAEYREAMKRKDMVSKVPERVGERLN